MSLGRYLLGSAELVAVLAALGFGAYRVRARLAPGLTGATQRLAEIVLGIAAAVCWGQLIGLLGLLQTAPFVAGCVTAGLLAGWLAGRRPASVSRSRHRPPGWEVALAVLIAALVVARWGIPTEVSLDRGMYAYDTLWYHLPGAAAMVQTQGVTALHYANADYGAFWLVPQNAELVHAEGMLIFGRDILSPVLNLGWLAIALLSAWCLGRPHGAALPTLLGGATVLGSGMLLRTQAGDATTDIAATAMLLAAAAILAAGRSRGNGWDAGAILIAGLAAGLCVGIKLHLLAGVATLTIGVVALEGERRLRITGIWLAAIAATGGYWYLRNTVVTGGNPLPWLDVGIGPFQLPGPEMPLANVPAHSVAHYLMPGRTGAVESYFLPGLRDGIGLLWPAVLVLGLAGGVLTALKGRGAVRVLGAAGLVAMLAYVVTPNGANGLEGEPRSFGFNLRYLAPGLALSLALLPLAPRLDDRRWRRWTIAGLLVLFAVTVRPDKLIDSGYLGGAAAIAILTVVAPATIVSAQRLGAPRVALASGCALLTAMAIGGGWLETRRYLDGRYRAQPNERFRLSAAYAWARGLHGERIGTTFNRGYGLFGPDLSNRVEYPGEPTSAGGYQSARTCETWKAIVNAAGYRYLVITFRDRPGERPQSPEARWTRADRGVTPLLEEGVLGIYRVDSPLRDSACGRISTRPPLGRSPLLQLDPG